MNKHVNAHLYTEVFGKWSTEKCGPKPSIANMVAAEKVFTPGNNNCISAMMQLRDGGMLSTEYACTGLKPAFNDVRTATSAGYFRAPAKPVAGRKNHVGKKLKVHKIYFVKAKRVAAKVKATKATTATATKAKAVTKAKVAKAVTKATSKATKAKATTAKGVTAK